VLAVVAAGNEGVDLDDTAHFVESPEGTGISPANTLIVAKGRLPPQHIRSYVGRTSAATVSGVAALANRRVPGLRGRNAANGLLSASGALAATAVRTRSLHHSNAAAP
jgi:hypothetical protein